MKKIMKTTGVLALVMVGLTSCGVGSLPHDERYRNIDKVLSDIDYQNIGTIVHEEIDNGDGIFIPSYKKIYYKEDVVFDKIFSKLRNAPENVIEDCSEKPRFPKEVKRQTQMYCTYYGNSVSFGRGKIDEYGSTTRITITDTMSGKG